MAVIDSKKLLPPAKSSGSALATQKFLVPVSNIKVKSSAIIKASDITPNEKSKDAAGKLVLSEVSQIRENILSIQRVIGSNTTLLQQSEERKRKLSEKEKFEKKEKKLEEKKGLSISQLKKPSLPRTGFLDAIKRFIFYTLLGAAFVKFGKYIPKLLEFSQKLIPAFKFVEDFAGNLLNGAVEFIDKGYKAYDKVREISKKIGGEDLQKKFDEFSKQFNTFANLAIIAGMATMGGTDLGLGKRGPGGPGGSPKRGFDITGRRVSRAAQERYASRYGEKKFLQRFGAKNVAAQAEESLASQGVKQGAKQSLKSVAAVPIIGSLIGFIIDTVVFRETPSRAAAGAVGSAIGQGIGIALAGGTTFGLGAGIGMFVGGFAGDWLGKALYDTLTANKKDPLEAKAKGGQVTRGGKTPSGPAKRTITKIKAKPPRVKPQKTIPGKDVGGRKKIAELFYDSPNPNQKSPLGVLETTSESLKKVPALNGSMGALLGLPLDLVMGQKPDANVFKKIGYGFGSLIQSSIDAETSNTISNIQKEIVGLAEGGAIPRTLSSGENIGMKIGERIARTLEAMMNAKVSETLQAIRQQFSKADITGAGPGALDPTGPDVFHGMGAERMWNFFKNKGLSDFAVAGIMGNARWESTFNPTARGKGMGPGGSDAIGIFQWGETDRWKNLVNWATSQNLNPWDYDTQLKFAWHEMQTSESGTIPALQGATSASDAAEKFRAVYERSKQTEQRRKDAAEGFYQQYKGKTYIPITSNIPLGDISGSLKAAQELASQFGLIMTSFNTGKHAKGSLHYQNRAMDFSNGINTPQQMAFAKEVIKRYGSSLAQLIYTPLGFGISGGKQVPLSFWGDETNNEHYHHVHVAFGKGGKVRGFTKAILGERGPEYVLDADTTSALEKNYPGFLDALNKADYKGALNVLQSYASYYNPTPTTTVMLQKVIIEKPVPVGGGGMISDGVNNSSASTSPITASLYSA